MRETRTLDDIQRELEDMARKMLTDAGYDILPDLPDVPSGDPSFLVKKA